MSTHLTIAISENLLLLLPPDEFKSATNISYMLAFGLKEFLNKIIIIYWQNYLWESHILYSGKGSSHIFPDLTSTEGGNTFVGGLNVLALWGIWQEHYTVNNTFHDTEHLSSTTLQIYGNRAPVGFMNFTQSHNLSVHIRCPEILQECKLLKQYHEF